MTGTVNQSIDNIGTHVKMGHNNLQIIKEEIYDMIISHQRQLLRSCFSLEDHVSCILRTSIITYVHQTLGTHIRS